MVIARLGENELADYRSIYLVMAALSNWLQNGVQGYISRHAGSSFALDFLSEEKIVTDFAGFPGAYILTDFGASVARKMDWAARVILLGEEGGVHDFSPLPSPVLREDPPVTPIVVGGKEPVPPEASGYEDAHMFAGGFQWAAAVIKEERFVDLRQAGPTDVMHK